MPQSARQAPYKRLNAPGWCQLVGLVLGLAAVPLALAQVPMVRVKAPSAAAAPAAPAAAPLEAQPGHLRLVDDLDRPQDGYCLDVLGSGPYIRFDMPLSAHNCKPGLYADEAVVLEPNGRIRFPAFNACVTAAGINQRALAGAALMPRGCGEKTPFLDAAALQVFEHRSDGRMELAGSGLCITVGQESDSTFDATHRWRSLFLQHCAQAPLAYSQWRFVIPVVQ